jgi:hypothetical protein
MFGVPTSVSDALLGVFGNKLDAFSPPSVLEYSIAEITATIAITHNSIAMSRLCNIISHSLQVLNF